MSEEVLSQEEIQALLSAVEQEEAESRQRERRDLAGKVKTYDFTRPDKFSKDQLRTLQALHEHMARSVEVGMAGYLRSPMETRVASVEELSFEEFTRGLSNPTVLAVVGLSPLGGSMALEINPNIGFAIVDRLLGGPGEEPRQIREFSEIELSVMRRIIGRMLESLTEAWKHVVELEAEIERMEVSPQFTQVAPLRDMTVVVSLDLRVGAAEGRMNLCYPYSTLEPVAAHLNAQSLFGRGAGDREGAFAGDIKERLASVRLPMRVILGESRVTLRDFSELRVGDVLQLNARVDEALLVKVGERPKFLGKPGQVGDRLAVEVVAVLDEEGEAYE